MGFHNCKFDDVHIGMLGNTSGTYAQAYTTRFHLEVQERGMVWSGVDWSRVGKWSGEVEWGGVECGGVEWGGVQ